MKIHCVFIVFACGGSFLGGSRSTIMRGCVPVSVPVCLFMCPYSWWWTSRSVSIRASIIVCVWGWPIIGLTGALFVWLHNRKMNLYRMPNTYAFLRCCFVIVWLSLSQGVVASADDVASSSINKLFVQCIPWVLSLIWLYCVVTAQIWARGGAGGVDNDRQIQCIMIKRK